MKYFFLFFFLPFLSFSQNFTEKWNEAYSRYEYRDNSGNLIGHKKWNSAYQRWDYTQVGGNSYSKNVTPVYEPVSRGDIDVDLYVLQRKQQQYDQNLKDVNKTYKSISGWIDTFSTDFSAKDINKLRNDMNYTYNFLIRNNDISSNQMRDYVKNYLWKEFDKKLCNDLDYCNFLTNLNKYLNGN